MSPPSEIFGQPFFSAWSEPTLPGSRDPLGLIPVWANAGEQLIPHVKTTAGDLAGWMTLLLSVAIADAVLAGDRERGDIPSIGFLHRIEKAIGYCRATDPHATGGVWEGLRGQGEMKKRVALPRIPLDEPVLANPGSAGVWGQISGSAGAAGLLDKDRRVLRGSPEELFGPEAWGQLASALQRPATRTLLGKEARVMLEPGGAHAAFADAVRVCFPQDRGQPLAPTLQRRLAQTILEGDSAHVALGAVLRRPAPGSLFARLRAPGLRRAHVLQAAGALAPEDQRTADALEAIAQVASVIGRSELAFRVLTHESLRGGTIAEAEHLLDTLVDATVPMPPDWSAGLATAVPSRDREELRDLGAAWESRDVRSVRGALQRRHEGVMRRRRHQPWVRVSGPFWDVRRPSSSRQADAAEAAGSLPKELNQDRLVHPYYLGAFASLAWDLGGRQEGSA